MHEPQFEPGSAVNLFDPHYKETRARSRIYLLLAGFFRRPSSHPAERSALDALYSYTQTLRENSDSQTAKVSIEGFRELTSDFLLAHERESVDERHLQYQSLFGPGGAIPLDESPYRHTSRPGRSGASGQKAQAETPAERAIGFDELPGRVLAELEFMHCLVEAEAEYILADRPEAASMCRRKQLSFLRGNLKASLPGLSRTLSESSGSDFYKLLVTATDMFADMDMNNLSISSRGAAGESFDAISSPTEGGQALRLNVDGSSCSLCGVCVRGCPNAALTLDRRDDMLTLQHSRRRCVSCEACARSCPERAIALTAGAADTSAAVLIARNINRCARCGRANDSMPFLDAVIERLGGDFSPKLLNKLSLCDQCRKSGLNDHTYGVESTSDDASAAVNPPFALQDEVTQV